MARAFLEPKQWRRVLLLATLWGLACADEPGIYRFTHHVTLADLPSNLERRAAPGVTPAELVGILAQQPTIILDHATLEITAPTFGLNRSLMVKRLELLNGSQIITVGVNLEIDAGLIVSDGGLILSFPEDPPDRPVAAIGRDGAAGLPAGTLVLYGELSQNDVLHVRLNGQNGEKGGDGVPGPVGARGSRGEDAADHAFDCAHGGGDGGTGAQGGRGGTGGRGGNGGVGGRLVLRGVLVTQRAQLDFSAPGGWGARGGMGGPGGPGGSGGEGGNGSFYCHGGHGGPSGSPGLTGEEGQRGANGADGSITGD